MKSAVQNRESWKRPHYSGRDGDYANVNSAGPYIWFFKKQPLRFGRLEFDLSGKLGNMGPLAGLKFLEIGGIGPGPFCAMMFADMGAEVVRIDRKGHVDPIRNAQFNFPQRGKRIIRVDLKNSHGVDLLLRLVETADVLTEGFRPGVMESLGLGPDVCLDRNPRLIYGRMTGWGQDGPLSKAAGHDINYISLTGALFGMGQKCCNPPPPLNLIGDYGGGAMFLAFGILCALLEARSSGKGQVVDTSIVDGVAALMGTFYGLRASGQWSDKRQDNLLDGGAPFYDTYETMDGKWISIGAIEPQFYRLLLKYTGLSDDPDFGVQMNHDKWTICKEKMAAVFKTRTRDEWCAIMEGTDACFAPVLTMEETFAHPHNVSRRTFIEVDGVLQPAPAPRFSRTKPDINGKLSAPGERADDVLAEWGIGPNEIQTLNRLRVI